MIRLISGDLVSPSCSRAAFFLVRSYYYYVPSAMHETAWHGRQSKIAPNR